MHPMYFSFVLGCLLAASNVAGQHALAAGPLYDQGAQAYFADRLSEADALLSQAVAEDLQDPRPLYFRGLCRLQLGQADNARLDMQLAAGLESQQPNQYAVGTALQRVQGAHRLTLEQYRRQGRAASANVRAQLRREAHHRITIQDGAVLREPVIIPLDELFRSEEPRALTVQELTQRRAAAEAQAAASSPHAPAPNATQPSADDPFREDSPTPPATASPTPPTIPPQPPADAEPEAEPEAAPEAQPEAESDPFGDFGT